MSSERDQIWLRAAIELGAYASPVGRAYSVGAIVVTAGGALYSGYSRETDTISHAEEVALTKARAARADLSGGTIYTSMEPCSKRASRPKSCSRLIIESGLARVVFALKEPPVFVECHGLEELREAGLKVIHADTLAELVRRVNGHLIGE